MRDGKEKKEKRRKRERKRKVRRREKRSEEGKIILEKRAGEPHRKSEFQRWKCPKWILPSCSLQSSKVSFYSCLMSPCIFVCSQSLMLVCMFVYQR
jgi:hypothetical protein